jgi:hypothetical protein
MSEMKGNVTGRRVALTVGVPVCLALTGFTGFNFVAQIGEGHFPVSYTFPAGTGPYSAAVSGGDMQLSQSAAGPARLSGKATYALIRPTVTEHASGGSAAFAYDCASVPAGNCSLNADMTVPNGSDVSVSTSGGNVTVTGTTGDVTLSTGGGDVTASNAAGDLILRTDGGNIKGTAITATRLSATTGGGDVEIDFTQVPRDITVSTRGGNVIIVVPPGTTHYNVSATTAGGSVSDTVPLNTSSPDKITVTSGGGDIAIRQAN